MDAIVSKVLGDDVDVKLADGNGLPVEGVPSRAREGVDSGSEVTALEVVVAGVGVEHDACDLLVAEVALGQRGQVGEAVLEDVEGACSLDSVGARRVEHEPAGAPGCCSGDGDVVECRCLEGAAADRRGLHILAVQVRGEVVDFEDAGDGVARCSGWGSNGEGCGKESEGGGCELHFDLGFEVMQ